MGRLFWKFFLAFWLALLAASLAVGSAVWLHRQAERDEASLLASGPRAAFLVNTAAAMLGRGGPDALREVFAASGRSPRMAPLFVLNDDGRDVFGRPVPAEATEAVAAHRDDGPTADAMVRRVTAPDGHGYTVFVAGEALHPRHGPRRRPPPAWVPLSVGLIASLAFSALLAWYVAKPIGLLRRGFDAAAAGRLETRVQPLMGRRRDELADLGRDFDHMVIQLQAQISAQRRLMHDVSHELRSPLARLQAAIGLLRQKPETLDTGLERIERESVRLDGLVGELLTLSRLESGTNRGPVERVELVEMVAAIADDARFEAEAAGRTLDFTGEGEVVAEVHGELLQRAFENVIRNAVKFTAPGTAVEVRVAHGAGAFVVTVEDHGPGVPDEDLQAIFEPFYRGGNASAAAGFGLGLAIARRAIEAHGGQIEVHNRAGGGLQVRMSLPLAPLPGA
jgi:two-component system OmpR family sensor kinase